MSQFNIKWIDRRLEPKHPPDPKYPNGIDLNMSHPEKPSCKTLLPYPAKRIGYYIATCDKCGLSVAVTTAGRPDDPRSLTVSCKDS